MTAVLSHGGLLPIRHNLSSVVIHRHPTLRHPTRRHPTRRHPTRRHPTHTAVSAPASTGSAFARGSDARHLHRMLQSAVRKVPEVTIFFWIVKVLTTGMGETTSDYLVHRLDPVIAVALGGCAFVVALALQLAARRYVAWIYWLAVVMVAV